MRVILSSFRLSTRYISYAMAIFIFLIQLDLSNAQSSSDQKSKSWIGLHGNLSIAGNAYSVSGIKARRNPYSFKIMGSPTMSIFNFQVPGHFSYQQSQFESQISNPFQRYGISPRYKWLKLHLGWSSLNYSQYVLSSRSFFGSAIELNPGKFYFSAFYGLFENYYAFDDRNLLGILELPSEKRKAMGMKIGLGKSRFNIGLSVVKSKDENTFDYSARDISYELRPKENLVSSLNIKLPLMKGVYIASEVAGTAFSTDQNARPIELSQANSNLKGLFKTNLNTFLSFAGDLSLNFNFKRNNIYIKYNRIEPLYQTLTSNFLKNDVENGTLGLNTFLFKRISFNSTIGLQRTDLRNNLAYKNNRLIGSLNSNWRINRSWNLSGFYANYQNFVSQTNLSDTLFRPNAHVAQTLGMTLKFTSNDKLHPFSCALTINGSDIEQEFRPEHNVSSYQASVNSSYGWKSLNFIIGANLFFNRYNTSKYFQDQYGGALFVSKEIKNKFNVKLSGNYLNKDYNIYRNGYILRSTLHLQHKVQKSHSIGLLSSLLRHKAVLSPSFFEFQSSLTYNFQF